MLSTLTKIGGLFLFALFWVQPASASPECNWPDDGTLSAILPIATDHGSHASGIVVSQNRVLTAAHALSGSDRVFVRVSNDFRLARIILLDKQSDLAVLSVDTENISPVPMTLNEPLERQPVWGGRFSTRTRQDYLRRCVPAQPSWCFAYQCRHRFGTIGWWAADLRTRLLSTAGYVAWLWGVLER